MFVDGVYNALFAHNVLLSIGSMWAPQTADYAQPNYWDNPQLSAVLLAQWYKVMGDYYWVEKLYSLCCALLQLLLITLSWKIVTSDDSKSSTYFWLPCLLFLISPLCGWAYSNNLMENTMSVFTTAAIVMLLLFMKRKSKVGLFSFLGGCFIFLAILSKGPVALFPLVAPVLFVWLQQSYTWKQCLGYTMLQLITVAVLFGIIFSLPAPNYFLQNYLAVQLLPVLNGQRSTGGNHFSILLDLLAMLSTLLPLALLSLRGQSDNSYIKPATSFLLVGLSASLPIMLSAKQNKHYLIPSLPMFALGFSFWIMPMIIVLQKKLLQFLNEKHLTIIKAVCGVIIMLCIYLCIGNAGTAIRDKALLSDIKKVHSYTPGVKVIYADWALYDHWALRAYLNRLYNKKICMPDENANTTYYLTLRNQRGDKLSGSSIKIFTGQLFDLYKTKK